MLLSSAVPHGKMISCLLRLILNAQSIVKVTYSAAQACATPKACNKQLHKTRCPKIPNPSEPSLDERDLIQIPEPKTLPPES